MHQRLWFSLFVIFLSGTVLLSAIPAEANPPARIAEVKGYQIQHLKKTPFPVDQATQAELEQILGDINQMAGMRSQMLPDQYVLFRFPKPVVLMATPVGHPVRELILTRPAKAWTPPRLLIKNGQNQWVEYRSNHPIAPMLDRVKAGT
ncbi:hypothetical protein [Salinithrix halophila]|uniref:Uncharacterized protein n=1 Tax=Salinithrix halophila TaxID=1485204 RepID=A0ABV8JI18_9BACL